MPTHYVGKKGAARKKALKEHRTGKRMTNVKKTGNRRRSR